MLINQKIQTKIDTNPPVDVGGMFLDISKLLIVWDKGLLFKLKCYGGEGKLLLSLS